MDIELGIQNVARTVTFSTTRLMPSGAVQITLISRMVGAMTGFLPFYVLIT